MGSTKEVVGGLLRAAPAKKVYIMTKEEDYGSGAKDMTKDANEVIEKRDAANLFDSGTESKDAGATSKTLEEKKSIDGKNMATDEAKPSQEVSVEKKMENGNGSKDLKEEKIVHVKERVEPVGNTSGIECLGEIKNGERVEKEPLSESNDGQLELITKDENSMESRTGTEIETGTTENIAKRPDGESREIGVGSDQKEEDDCDFNNNTDNAKSDLSSEADTDPQARGAKVESKSGDGGLDKLHKLEPIWVKRAEILLGEKKETRADLLQELRRLVATETNLTVPQDDPFFLMYLRAGLMSPNQGFQVMKNYFNLRSSNPEYFLRSTQLEFLAREVYSKQIHVMLPNRDREGRRVYIFRPGRWDPDKIALQDLFCAGYMLCEMVVREKETQIAGIVSITDASGFGFKHLRAIGLEDGKNMASFFNVSFPLYMRQTHVLHAPRVFNMVFNMLKPFLTPEVRDGVVFHSGDLTTLRDYVPVDILPSDVGGRKNAPSMDNSSNVEELRTLEGFFQERTEFGFGKK